MSVRPGAPRAPQTVSRVHGPWKTVSSVRWREFHAGTVAGRFVKEPAKAESFFRKGGKNRPKTEDTEEPETPDDPAAAPQPAGSGAAKEG